MRTRAAYEGEDTRPPPDVCMITVAFGSVGSGSPVVEVAPAVSSRLAAPVEVEASMAPVEVPLLEEPLSPPGAWALGSVQLASKRMERRETTGSFMVPLSTRPGGPVRMRP